MSKKLVALILTAAMCIPAVASAAQDTDRQQEKHQERQQEEIKDPQKQNEDEKPEVPTEVPTSVPEKQPEPVEVTPEPAATPEPVIETPEPVTETPAPVITAEPVITPEATPQPEKQPEEKPTKAPAIEVTSQPQEPKDPEHQQPNQQNQYPNGNYGNQPQQPQPPRQPEPPRQLQPPRIPEPPRTQVVEKIIIVTPQEAKTSFDEKKQLKETSQLDARDCINQIKALFRSADAQTKLEILAEIAQLKKELNDEAIGIFVNGIDLDFTAYDNAQPYIKNDVTLVPLRAVADALNANIQWDDKIRKITMTKGDKAVIMQIDNKNATVNGKKYALESAPEINNDRTMVPLRFISEALDSDVQWDSDSRTVIIENDDDDDYDDYYYDD
ncbi:MAG: stalk domain-containing protein [Candidatus Ornithomonoglobus sp.]